MRVVVADSAAEVGRRVAEIVGERAPAVMGVATGSSPMPAYAEIVDRRLLPQTAHLCLLDEYVGLSSSHPQRYRSVIRRALADPLGIPPEHVHAPDVDADDLEAAADEYEQLLAGLGGVDLQLLGIGRNGHIGFNEPGTPFASPTHVASLDETTRRDNSRFFPGVDDVPHTVITQGPATIRRARSIVLIATGDAKRAAMGRLLSGTVSVEIPATSLHDHPDLTVIGDRAALDHLDSPDHLDTNDQQENRP